MGFMNKLKKSVKSVAKQSLKQVASPEGILATVAPQLGVTNALVKGLTGGQIDPLKIATGFGKDVLKGQFEGSELVNSASEVIDVAAGSVKMGANAYNNLRETLEADNLAKIANLDSKAISIAQARSEERSKMTNNEQSTAINETDLSQPNIFSKVFYAVMKNMPVGYTPAKPLVSLVMNSNTYANLTLPASWGIMEIDDFHEWLTDLVKVPLMSTPVSSVSTLITLINGILAKLDDDTAMIEFLACFNYPGSEVVLPNIEGRSPLANACLSSLTKEMTYKYMNQWVSATYRGADELDFYREVMSEWLGNEISIAHPMYVDMISSAVISLKGHTIARYLLENCCPYMTNSSRTNLHARYNETKLNPYDLLQFCRNIQLNAQISYSNAIKPTATTAQAAIAQYHLYSYLILTLCVKLLSDATIFMKSCMTQTQIDQINNDLIIGTRFQYVYDLSNSENAWISTIGGEELARAISDAQMEYSGLTIGDTDLNVSEVEEGIDAVSATVSSATDLDVAIMGRYRQRATEYKTDIRELLDSNEINETKYNQLLSKIDNMIALINSKMGA